ncbi:hypothetical protein HYT23_02230 [Candidatus Pacearchaeota archaeon]|nr:hypothetical protein [Candidatus Pacearchaeota archaeon]
MEDVFSYMTGREGSRISEGFKIRRAAYDSRDDEGVTNDEINPNYEGDLPYSGTIHRIRDSPDLKLED